MHFLAEETIFLGARHTLSLQVADSLASCVSPGNKLVKYSTKLNKLRLITSSRFANNRWRKQARWDEYLLMRVIVVATQGRLLVTPLKLRR